MNKYLRPIVGGLPVAMTMTATHTQEYVQNLLLKPLAPINTK
jgi:hypothetical protein